MEIMESQTINQVIRVKTKFYQQVIRNFAGLNGVHLSYLLLSCVLFEGEHFLLEFHVFNEFHLASFKDSSLILSDLFVFN